MVVTDLYNYAMPMIRYDTGDLATVADHDRGEPTALRSIEGRRADVIHDTSGRQLSVAGVSVIMVARFLDIERYQLVQEDASSFHLRVALGKAEYSESDFSAALAELLGADARVWMGFLESIPDGPGGKHRPVISHYLPDATRAESDHRHTGSPAE